MSLMFRSQLHALVVLDVRLELLLAHHDSTEKSVLVPCLLSLVLYQLAGEVFFDNSFKLFCLRLVLNLEQLLSRTPMILMRVVVDFFDYHV